MRLVSSLLATFLPAVVATVVGMLALPSCGGTFLDAAPDADGGAAGDRDRARPPRDEPEDGEASDGGTNEGSEGAADAGADGTADAGTDGTADGGADEHPDAGSQEADGGSDVVDAGAEEPPTLCEAACRHIQDDCNMRFVFADGQALNANFCAAVCGAGQPDSSLTCLATATCDENAMNACGLIGRVSVRSGAGCLEMCDYVYETCGLSLNQGETPIPTNDCNDVCTSAVVGGSVTAADLGCVIRETACDRAAISTCLAGEGSTGGPGVCQDIATCCAATTFPDHLHGGCLSAAQSTDEAYCSVVLSAYVNGGYCPGRPGPEGPHCTAFRSCCIETTTAGTRDRADCINMGNNSAESFCETTLATYHSQGICR